MGSKMCEELPMDEFCSSSIKILPGERGNTILHKRTISGCQSKCQRILEKHLKRTGDCCEMNKAPNTAHGTICRLTVPIISIRK